jgi:probable HAF family extracellular repeat protein
MSDRHSLASLADAADLVATGALSRPLTVPLAIRRRVGGDRPGLACIRTQEHPMSIRTLVSLGGVLVPALIVSAQVTFTPLAPLPLGTGYCVASAISPGGAHVVGSSEISSGYRAVHWGPLGLPIQIDEVAGVAPRGAASASADGSVIVGQASVDGSCPQPFRWSAQTGPVALGVLPPGLPTFAEGSRATDVSADGSVVVGYQRGPDSVNFEAAFKAWRWTASTGMVELGALPDSTGVWEAVEASAVSADGATIVGFDISVGVAVRAFRWTQAGGMQAIGDLPGGQIQSYANDVSADGSVIVGNSATEFTDQEAFRWTQAGGMVALGDLPGGEFRSDATAVSADGSVIVGRANIVAPANGGGSAAFIWDAQNGMRDLKQVLIAAGATGLDDWQLHWPTGISADGRTIVGWGTSSSGIQQGWIATVGSTPACPADFNHSGGLEIQDIFDFLNAWFAGSPAADINGGGLAVQDIFDFLNAWFAGC